MTPMNVSILLPIYNEKENIPALLAEIEAIGPQLRSFEVVAVDDGSTDGTRDVLVEMARQKPFLRVLLFRANRGQTAAFDAGFAHASGEIIVTMDADRQNDPADIPGMVNLIRNDTYDFVTGWRKNRKDGFVLRKFPSRIANWIIRKVTKTKVHDLGCSLKVYRASIAKELRLYGEMHRFIAVLCENLGARVGEVEVHHRPRVAGVSKYNLTRTIKVVLDLLTIWFMKGFHTKPIYIFGGIGVALLASSFGISGFVLYQKFFQETWVHRNPLFIISVFFGLVGFMFLGMGLLAELLIRVHFESQGLRPYSVAQKLGFPDSK